jgi:hypothetical protein
METVPSTSNCRSSAISGYPGTDFIDSVPSSENTTVTPAYTYSGNVVGQRVEKVRGDNGLRSRLVFLGFGMEGVNRRFTKDAKNNPYALNVRAGMASGIVTYFRTGSIRGQVINNQTRQPIPNLFLEVTGSGGRYIVKTDANGRYLVEGLPLEGYEYQVRGQEAVAGGRPTPQLITFSLSTSYAVRPAVDNQGRQITRGYKGQGQTSIAPLLTGSRPDASPRLCLGAHRAGRGARHGCGL